MATTSAITPKMTKTTAMNITNTAYSDGVVSLDGIGKRIISQVARSPRADSDMPVGQFLASEHQGLLKLLSAVSIVVRSSGDMLGVAFFII